MPEYPREFEGGVVREIFPQVFYAPNPDAPESYAEGARIGYDSFEQVATELDFRPADASRSFNDIYVALRRTAIRQKIILPLASKSTKPYPWDYLNNFGTVNPGKRRHILLATEALEQTYNDYLSTESSFPTPRRLVIIEHLIKIDGIGSGLKAKTVLS